METMTPEEVIKSPWSLGFKDRGLGHGDYAIMIDKMIVVKCPSYEVAKHILELHNK